MTSRTRFEERLAAALRTPAPGDPPFPLDRIAVRLAGAARGVDGSENRPPGGRAAGASPPHSPLVAGSPSLRRRAAAAAAAFALFGAGTAVGAWVCGARPPERARPRDPMSVTISSIVLRGASVGEALDAIFDEAAREFPEPERRLRRRIELPEGTSEADLPPVNLRARGADVVHLIGQIANAVDLDVRTEEDGTVVLFPCKPFEPGPEDRVWWGNEWNRDPATRPPVLRVRFWTLPDTPPPGAGPLPATSAEWRDWLAERGVDWAYGTELACNAPLGLLRVAHAPETLDSIDTVLRGVGASVSEPVAEEESDAP